jgi:predicted ester cyclase
MCSGRPIPADTLCPVIVAVARTDNWVVTRVTMRGTHGGAWQGIQPTGKTVEVTAANIDRVVDGRIVEHGGAANLLGPLLAIGAIQMPSARIASE